MNKRNFIVLGAGRSGSTLLVNLLNAHPRIRCHGEILNEDHSDFSNIEDKSRRRLKLYIRSFFQDGPCCDGSYLGVKFLTSQFDELDISLADILEALHQPKVLLIYRKNMLESYVSLLLAQRSGIWYSTTGIPQDSTRVEWPDFLAYAECERRRWRECLAELDGPVQYITYEGIVKNLNSTMSSVFEFLHLEACKVSPQSVRQNPAPLDEKIENYAELGLSEAVLQGNLTLELPGGVQVPE